MKIINAKKTDAPMIAGAIMDAIGEKICLDLAGKDHTLDDVKRLFTDLAAMDDSQYSYLNTLAAVDHNGETIGICVGYDGADLEKLRAPFFALAGTLLGKDFGDISDETDSSEFYIDTLAVLPEHRGKGVASALLRAAIDRARKTGKPAGLLVDKDNSRARRLYEKIGFRQVGERPFCYVMMDHMQCK